MKAFPFLILSLSFFPQLLHRLHHTLQGRRQHGPCQWVRISSSVSSSPSLSLIPSLSRFSLVCWTLARLPSFDGGMFFSSLLSLSLSYVLIRSLSFVLDDRLDNELRLG